MANTRRPSGTSHESADKVLQRELPTWHVVGSEEEPEAVTLEGDAMKTEDGPSISMLRQKFGVEDNVSEEPDFNEVDPSVDTVRIAPNSGGPAKTADIKNGKVRIVQG